MSLTEINKQINELLKASIQSEGVINLFDSKTVGENFSLFDPHILEEIAKMKEKNIAVEILRKLMAEQVAIYKRTNVVKSEKFSEKIAKLMNAYYNGLITNEEVIKELLETENLSVYFLNKNHLSYFIAKYLIRLSQGEPADTSGIEYALENICFGINSDIVLFISYILNNTRILTSISNYAGELLKPWDALSLSDKNISLLHNIPLEQINPPSDEERKKYEKVKEESEETHYSEDIIEAKGLFDYDDTNIDQYQYRLVRALKYTEMICKALPAFHSKLKLNQKNDLVDSIYLYPRKIWQLIPTEI